MVPVADVVARRKAQSDIGGLYILVKPYKRIDIIFQTTQDTNTIKDD